MGLFSKLKKQISFKNLVKTVGKVGSMAPGIGGMVGGLVQNAQDAHYAKKENAQQIKLSQAQGQARQNPNIGEILMGGAGGALTGMGGVLGGSTTAGQAGATLAQSTIKEWFKQHWWKVAIGVSIIGVVIYFAVRKGNKAGRRR